MLVVRGTQKLLKRVRGPMAPDWAASTGELGDWFATALFWKPQVALLVNSRTLIPAFVPLAPARKLWMRIPDEIHMILSLHGVDLDVVNAHCRELEPVGFAPTNDRRVLGVMNEFTRLAEHFRDDDLRTLSLRLASTPISSLREGGGFPDQALADIFGTTPPELPEPRTIPAPPPEPEPTGEPEHLAKIIPFPVHRATGE